MSKPTYNLSEEDEYGRILEVKLPAAVHPIAFGGDWYGDTPAFQLVVNDGEHDDAQVSIRFNPDGTLHSVFVGDDVVVERDGPEQSEWARARYPKP